MKFKIVSEGLCDSWGITVKMDLIEGVWFHRETCDTLARQCSYHASYTSAPVPLHDVCGRQDKFTIVIM